nr:hypothetical protein [Tanacetum cinerariifolium]
MFPVLSRMAIDLISVQASSVASESAYSTSGRVLSIRRTRFTLASLEMCMCLKDHLDAKERKQDKYPLEIPLDFEEVVFDDDVKQNEAIPLSDEVIELDASSEGTLSPRGPPYDYMMTSEAEDVLPLKTVEEVVAREREKKAMTTLLMALQEDHLAKLHKMVDAKEMWEGIKSRFDVNDESKKMQKYLLKQQFEGFSVSTLEGLLKGYNRFQTLLGQLEIHGAGVSHEDANQQFLRSLPSSWSQVALIMRTKPMLDTLSFDDLYNNLRGHVLRKVEEDGEVKVVTGTSYNLEDKGSDGCAWEVVGWFTSLLEALHEMFPKAKLPSSTYQAKKLICPMGMEIEKIDVCPKDCMLYGDNDKDLHAYRICGSRGPKQPGNDIGIYLKMLIKDMQDLWSKGVEVYDAYKKETSQMRAMIFCTISDFPAYGNLSGYKTKGKLACPMIPIAIHGILLDRIRHTITKLCLFFNKIHSKVIDPELLDQWQRDIILTIYKLKMYFPPSLFDVMVHSLSHIVREIKTCGPTFLRDMYPFEIYMGILKGYVRNRSRSEGSIIEGYATQEAIKFYTDYSNGVKTIGIPQSRHEGRLHGEGTLGRQDFSPNIDDLREAHFTILQHMTCIAPYIYEHKSLLKQQNNQKGQSRGRFGIWTNMVVKYQGYVINGYTFYTKEQDDKSTLQNSGVTLIALTTELSTVNRKERSKNAKKAYYGVIQEIWELHYNSTVILLFKCKWVDNVKGVDGDEDGFTTVNLSTNGYRSEPSILAKLATQAFYDDKELALVDPPKCKKRRPTKLKDKPIEPFKVEFDKNERAIGAEIEFFSPYTEDTTPIARGMIYPIGDGTIHGGPLIPYYMKVSIDSFVLAFGDTKLPVVSKADDTITLLEQSVMSFFQWPRCKISRTLTGSVPLDAFILDSLGLGMVETNQNIGIAPAAIIDRQLPLEYTIISRSTDVVVTKEYVDQVKCLGYVLPQDLTIGLILNGLTKDFARFVKIYNMHNMGKKISEQAGVERFDLIQTFHACK